jgi:hypothetical protein
MTLCVVCPVLRPASKPMLPDFPPVHEGCRTQIRAELAEIPDLYALIPASLEPGTGTGVKVSGTRTPPLPLALNPLNLLVGAPGGSGAIVDPFGDQHGAIPPVVVLDLWVRDWIDVRARDEHDPVPTIATLTSWLIHRLDWALDHHPAIDEFAREVHLTLRTIKAVTQAERKGEPVGRCPMETRDGGRCGTKLYADPYVDQISCGRCGTSWERRRWLTLAAAQDDVRDGEEAA